MGLVGDCKGDAKGGRERPCACEHVGCRLCSCCQDHLQKRRQSSKGLRQSKQAVSAGAQAREEAAGACNGCRVMLHRQARRARAGDGRIISDYLGRYTRIISDYLGLSVCQHGGRCTSVQRRRRVGEGGVGHTQDPGWSCQAGRCGAGHDGLGGPACRARAAWQHLQAGRGQQSQLGLQAGLEHGTFATRTASSGQVAPHPR